jgi:5-methyltetrahydropteroyltriglutamate--homocysteine methyltransferase
MRVAAYQHGIYPRSEAVVAATRGLERGRVTLDEVDAAFEGDLRDLVDVQRSAGLDYFSDGLLRWQDIFRPLVETSGGLEARTLVRWFDNNSFFRAPEIVGELALSSPVPDVYSWDDAVPVPRVATLPSPYAFSRATHGDRDVIGELTREVLGPVVRSLGERGYEVIHLQEPWLGYFGIDAAEWDPFEKALTDVRDAAGDRTLVLHVYFGDAGPHADRLRALPVDVVGIDFIETDPASLGTGWEVGLLAGVLDGRSSPIESVDATVAFVKEAVERTGAPSLFVSSNAELELLPRDLARKKVERLGEIAARLKEELS